MTYAKFLGGAQLRARVEKLTKGLREAASGEVTRRAAEKVRTQVDAVAHKYAAAHQLSGAALRGLSTVVDGSFVRQTSADYLRFHDWWPFHSDIMPDFILRNALKIFTAELEAALSDKPSPLLLLEEAAEAKAAAKRARLAAKAARAEKRAMRAQAQEAKLKARIAKIDARIKAREDRE